MISQRRRRGASTRVWVTGALALALWAPAAAQGSTLDVDGANIFYTADPGETNQLVITLENGNEYVFDEPFTAGSGDEIAADAEFCAPIQPPDPGYVRCTIPFPVNGILADVQDQSDSVTTSVPVGHTLIGGAGSDTLTGGPMADGLFGGDDADVLSGGEGDDQFRGDNGLMTADADTIHGGGGTDDTIFYEQTLTAVTVDLAAGTGGELGAIDTLSGLEKVFAGEHDDTLDGDANANSLIGGAGDDEIDGRAGGDTLIGSTGEDTLRAGADPDHDSLDGGADDDQLFADDGTPTVDGLDCGETPDPATDNDSATADPADEVFNCENTVQLVPPPSPTSPPTISGTAQEGQQLSAAHGGWNSSTSVTFSYQWLRCDGSGGACTDISGATGDKYTLVAADVSHTIRVRVTALNSGGSNSNQSQQTAVVTAAPASSPPGTSPTTTTPTAPVNSAPPQIPPSPATPRAAGQQLTGTEGTWSGTAPITLQYVWLRCSPTQTLQCTAATVAGPLGPYRLSEQDIGRRIRLAEIATNSAGQVVAFSEPTSIVTGILRNTALPEVWGPRYRGATLTAIPGGWAGTQPIDFTYAWESCDDAGNNCQARGTKQTQSISKAEIGRQLRVRVTATDARTAVGTAVSEPSPIIRARPKMPDLRPVAGSGGGFKYLSSAKAKRRLKKAGLCFTQGQACGTRLPVDLELLRRGKQDVPSAYQPTIRSGRVFDQDPDPDDEVSGGEEVEMEIYDPARNELCAEFLKKDINQVKAELGTDPDRVLERLKTEYCVVAQTVRTQSGSVTKPIVSDVNRTADGKAFVVYILEPRPTLPYRAVPQVDTDGDGLWDDWETLGVDIDKDGYYDLDLAAMGASPRRKDIFMEVDYMENHALDQAAVDSMVNAFANAPVTNIDGSTGISVHVDNGPNSIMNPLTNAKWGTLSDSDQLDHVDRLGVFTASTGDYDWGAFDRLKNGAGSTPRNLAAARSTTFRYVISLHSFAGNNIGRARDMPDVEKLGITFTGPSDMIVAANQPCATGHCPLNSRQQGVNLMHELGHLLGLGHGGRSGGVEGQPDITNGKPNYFSIMNYLFSFNGLRKNDGTFVTDYSRFSDSIVASLDESSLSELANARASSPANQFGTGYVCRPPGKALELRNIAGLNQQVDWDCSGKLDSTRPAVDVTNDSSFGTLVSREDWNSLKFVGGAVGQFNAAPPSSEQNPTIEPSARELLEAAQVIGGDAKRPTVSLRIGRPARRTGKVKLRVGARDNKALAQIVVLLDGKQRTFRLRGRKATRKLTVGPGRHRVRVESQDAIGNYSKAVTKRFRARKAPKRRR